MIHIPIEQMSDESIVDFEKEVERDGVAIFIEGKIEITGDITNPTWDNHPAYEVDTRELGEVVELEIYCYNNDGDEIEIDKEKIIKELIFEL